MLLQHPQPPDAGTANIPPAGLAMADLAFALQAPAGGRLPAQHHSLLAQALLQALPGLAHAQGAGVHRLTVAREGDGQPLLPQRARLVLRLPQPLLPDARAMQGRCLDLAGYTLQLGSVTERELLPWGTLYAHRVASTAADEIGFMQQMQADVQQLGITCRPICGRYQPPAGGAPAGYSLMLDGLNAADALRLLSLGLGPQRLLGCGLFVPHRSAAAVGAPD